MKGIPVPDASACVYATFVGLPVVVAFALWCMYRVADRATAPRETSSLGFGVGLFLWMWVTAGIALSGALTRFDLNPPPFILMLLTTFGLSLYVALSRIGEKLASLPLAWLVGLNAFRLPLEIAMHQAAREDIMPDRMSFAGWNFDILTGVTAIVLALLIHRGKASVTAVRVWNIGGLLLLVNIVTIAILSSPLVRAFGKGAKNVNSFVAFFPYVWLPAVLVATALTLHIVIERALRRKTAS